ncbi:alpha/beta hydrolase [Rhodococcus sp. 05-340-1]|uniref:alpha/beta hydrolase n=1 Tax=unclassified Rhodococcus (in: high G+C Gram-positive bacteria) TaxID=192944 RepID=UPI000B9C4927|nr:MULTISPECIES: alpha/beta hydrolase [unclassified Rhodococcus (in: high G+C Gram-positive bacteria)]OZD69987.1 alpha/beta hydrolase [Rhodococcus sp. 05-340-2]OZD83363.1 alpha/beta hydrolase [Rhodococcus sp. 05-340-1]
MTRTRLGAGRYIDAAEAASNTVTSAHELTTADGAKVSGVLRTVPGAETVVALMHPRQDLTHHVLVPELLARGYAVWTQGTRSVNNDISLVHEQALLDAAAGQVFLRSRSFDHVVTLGHSGGGTLFAFYHEQAGLAPGDRLAATPAGRPIDLASAEMPVPDGAIFMAPHPGQGALLLRLIDPSVVDESDPMSVDPALDPFDTANGFVDAPESSTYSTDFVQRYRAAQLERVARLDAIARSRVAEASAARRRFETSGNPADRRDALAPRILTVYRTDADLRFTDLSLSPNARPYGSLFGRRPDLTNFGLVGFARLSTPDAWLSTWSGLSSNANFVRCAPSVTVPSLFVELTGDQACFPEDASRMVEALGSVDKSRVAIEGTHFGGPIRDGAPTGASLAAADIDAWLSQHFI